MLTKFETKSNQVRGLSFHPKRPWILSSLHTGVIQLWDYRMATLIDTFEEHEGPVRGVYFHISQPLFVSGGDDYKIKVWNYRTRKCLFTLVGHLDYIRTVQFHHEYPWIVSASDDQTIRIWNWQSRTCVSVLTGHEHYVMCASFHPKEDLVVSASLDQTVRVWDIDALRKNKNADENTDLFGGVDATVKYVLEGHDRGVNWAAFHPTLPLIVSGADDYQVKLWRTNETKAWEVDTLRGHTSNVSSVMFHPKKDIIVSNSEDKSIRVWDATTRTVIKTFRRENNRFWTLAVHPETNLLAAGHDSGMMVFKLERERPAFALSGGGDSLLYVKDGFLRCYEYSTQKDSQVIPIQSSSPSLNQSPRPRTLSYSPRENAVLICSDIDGGSYELYIIPEYRSEDSKRRTSGGSAVFVARNRFAVLDKSTSGQEEEVVVLVKNLKNEVVKKIPLPIPTTDAIFYAGTGKLLCRSADEEKVVMFDLTQRLVLGEVHTPSVGIKYVVWSNDMESVALLSKHTIILASKNLVVQCTLQETIPVKSGAWDDDNNGVFIYTTLNHVKYCLPNGDSGIIRTLDVPIYITKVTGNRIFCLDRDGINREITVDASEYMFKLALMRKRYDHVMRMIKSSSSRISGQAAMIAYLHQKGFPEVALHFVGEEDERVRFDLAIESGNMSVAAASATKINEKDYWCRLGAEALRQGGNSGVAEFAYQQTRNFERLSFLYLITGNLEKLWKLMKIAEVEKKKEKNVMGQFQNALCLGDVKGRVKILENATGLLPLAYITASVHGLEDIAERLSVELGEDNVPSLPQGKTHSLLTPPVPVMCGGDWPLLRVMKGIFEGGLESATCDDEEEDDVEGDWGDALDMEEEAEAEEEGEGCGWEELELPTELDTPKFSAFSQGTPVSHIWSQKSSLAAEQAAAGSFDTAMSLLHRQLGIKNFAPLKPMFLDLFIASHSYLGAFPSSPVVPLAIERGSGGPPALVYDFYELEEKLKSGYKATTDGKFHKALPIFLSILQTIPLLVVESRSEVDEVKELVTIVKEYILGLNMMLKQKEAKDDPVRQQELAAYFTHCNLQPPHLRLALRNAMNVCYKSKNLATACSFARRLLETNPTQSQADDARKVVQAAERSINMTDETKLNYDFRNPFVICGSTYVPIYRGQKDVSCPYCTARFVPSQEGNICAICDLAVIGADASGLLCSPTQVR
ncbi:WD40 repeat-containing protein [Hirschfeldia incana]|nr:WD40 repeat-containing protein [Hirschfeldia incana]